MQERLDEQALVELLDRHGVKYVVIGGLAAVASGSPFPTEDMDITPKADSANLARLSNALTEIHAKVRFADATYGLDFAHDYKSLATINVLNLVTDFGFLDIALVPSGTTGYEDLIRHAFAVELGGVVVPFAALADVIRSKEAAGREKDRLVLPTLRDILRRNSS